MAIFGTHIGKGHTAAVKEKTLASLLRQREAAIISRRGLKSSGPGCIVYVVMRRNTVSLVQSFFELV